MAAAAAAKLLQLCLTLCDPMDGSLPGSSVHGIFQARVLEWGAIAFSGTYGYQFIKNFPLSMYLNYLHLKLKVLAHVTSEYPKG